MKRLLSIWGVLLVSFSLSVAQETPIPVTIARYQGDKICAISYTFDDGLKEHYTHAAPQLEKRGFRGTFWINGAKINEDTAQNPDTTRMNWQELREMIAAGHEISNHGWSHCKLTAIPLEDAIYEIRKNDTVIFE